ncbi:unnamed protein product, partial [Prorocentrum cordatum]
GGRAFAGRRRPRGGQGRARRQRGRGSRQRDRRWAGQRGRRTCGPGSRHRHGASRRPRRLCGALGAAGARRSHGDVRGALADGDRAGDTQAAEEVPRGREVAPAPRGWRGARQAPAGEGGHGRRDGERRLFDLHAQRAREQSAELEAEAVLLAQQQQRQVAALQQPQAVFGEETGARSSPRRRRERSGTGTRRKAKDQQQQPLPPAGPAAAVLLAELAPPADLATRTARRGRRLRPRGREEAGRRSRPWLRRPRGGPAGPVDAVGADDAAAAAGDAPRAAGPRGAAPAAVPRSGPRPERHGPPAHGAAAAADGRPASRGDRWETCWEYVQTGCCPRGPTCRWEHPPLGPMAFAQGIQFFPGEMKEAAGPPPFLPGNVSPLPLGAGPPLQFQPCGAGPPPAGPGQPGGGDLGERQAPEAARGAAEGAGAEAEAELGGAREED